MTMFSQDLRLEALSVMLGADVKPLNDLSTQKPITPGEFILLTIFGYAVDLIYTWGASQLSKSDKWLAPQPLDTLQSQGNDFKREFFVDLDQFFDPKYDYDFTNLKSDAECKRGGESYIRPKGWYRMALKVEDKYPDGNTWLGPDGWRSDSADGEWPVAYHGTSLGGAKGIIQSHYKAGSGQRYGRGIYFTPFIDSAIWYTKDKEFTSKKNGKRYRVILQNRINPLKREQCDYPKYWMIPIPEHLSSQQEREIVEGAVRPYGILIQEVTG